MIKRTIALLYGLIIWKFICIKYRINHDSVVLFLTDENEKIDYYALAHLESYMDLKKANKALVFYKSETTLSNVKKNNFEKNVKFVKYNVRNIEMMYTTFCFYKYFENVVFTYLDTPKDNLILKLLNETEVNEEEIVCLGLYVLRRVPKLKVH